MEVGMRSVLGAWVIAFSVLLAGNDACARSSGKQQSYETAFYPSGKLKIEAYIFKPEGSGSFPIVIYNHGSRAGHEREARPFAYVGEILVRSRCVVVVPERRGYGK